MKKIVLSLAVVFAMGMVACGGSEKKADDSMDNDTQIEVVEDSAEVEAAPAEDTVATEEVAEETTTTTTTKTKSKKDKVAETVKEKVVDPVKEKTEKIVEQGKEVTKSAADKLREKMQNKDN